MAEFAANNFSTVIASALDKQTPPWDASTVTDVLTSTFRRNLKEGSSLRSAGSTTSVAVRVGTTLYLASVGDSTTFLASGINQMIALGLNRMTDSYWRQALEIDNRQP